jgi:hypothetical protein
MSRLSPSMSTLLDAVRRHAEAQADKTGVARTPIAGLTTVRATMPSGLVHAISRPLACLVLQGRKLVTMGAKAFSFGAGDSLLITADVPTVSQITVASVTEPYLSLVVELEPATIADLAVQMKAIRGNDNAPVRVDPTDAEVADAALRLMRLLDRTETVPVLHAQLHPGIPLLAVVRPAWRGGPPSWLAGRPRAAHRARGRGASGGICAAVAGRTTGGSGRHEPIVVSPALSGRDLTLAIAIPKAVAPDRGETADDVRRRLCKQRSLCRGL